MIHRNNKNIKQMETITFNFETITALTIAVTLFLCGIAFLIINNKHI